MKITQSGTLASAVADDGTFAPSYPDRPAPESGAADAGSFYQGFFHRLVMNQAKLVYPDDFDISFGTSTITITNKTGAAWASGSDWTLELDMPGKRVYGQSDGNVREQPMGAMARADTFMIDLGAPDTADSNGYIESQDLTAAGVFSVDTTVAAALLAAALDGVADVPRNVVASWTTTSVLTVTGKDQYGNTIVESSASGTSMTGTKAFKEVTDIEASISITALTVGTGDVLGLPVYLPGRQHVLAEIVDGRLVGDREPIYLPFQCNETDLLAATAQQIVAPCAGRVSRLTTVVQVAFGATASEIGIAHLEVNGDAVAGSTIDGYATDDAVGSDRSASIALTATDAPVVAGDAISFVPSAAWASAGALNGTVEVIPTGSGIYKSGTFVSGMTTAGGSTATTGDVRGTYDPPVACDGSIVFQLLVTMRDPGNRGAPQHSG